MAWLFWSAIALIVYVYVGYPVILSWRARRGRQAPVAGGAGNELPPRVSIVIAARNEARRLPARLENLLRLDYPADRRQIIVVSDGSTDDTLDVLRPYAGQVDVVAIPPGGKAAALNAAVPRATGELLVFADARQTFAPDALRELARPFRDPRVGAVTGELRLDCESTSSDSTIGDGVGLYWQYEKAIRRSESAIDSTLGATGAIYALRRSLWRPLPPDTILDDVLTPMRAVLGGFRVVFNDRARAFDRAAPHGDAELRRKIRTLAGNVQILWLEPRLLLPWTNRVWLQYVSHKLGRLVVPYALLALFLASVALARESFVYQAALGGQVAFYLLAGYGAWLDLHGRAKQRAQATAPEAIARAGREAA
jgi:cellulose synthase/poly-beta-1,6-N-acetylglucosamine synthase-like glycosyltransferase